MPHKHAVPVCVRTGQVVEPMLTDQWFVAMTRPGADGTTIAGKAIDAVASGAVKFHPPQWINTYDQWMKNIQDWCISRQLWWGHQIPAWYGDGGEIFVARSEDEARAKAEAAGYAGALVRDADVLDTWYSSALVPFSSLGWPKETEELELFLPSSVLVTGYDIIFFWVARMIMMTLHFTGKVPFRDVYIHGLVRDASGKRMSKSEGNVLDPVDLIDGIALEPLLEKRSTGLRRPETAPRIRKDTAAEFPNGIPGFGADALRFTFCSLASLGRNVNFDAKRCEGYRNFCNKLWNATRFVLMNTEGRDCGLAEHTKAECAPGQPFHNYLTFSQADRWITGELQRVEAAVAARASPSTGSTPSRRRSIPSSGTSTATGTSRSRRCSCSPRHESEQRATRRTLLRVLETVLRLLHPITPFITAELWERVALVAGRKTVDAAHGIVVAPYPKAQLERVDPAADAWMEKLKAIVGSTRNLRSEMNLAPGERAPLVAIGDAEFVRAATPLLKSLARLSEVTLLDDDAAFAAASSDAPVAVVGAMRLALQVKIDRRRRDRAHRQGNRRGSTARSRRRTPSSPTSASSRARRRQVVAQEKRRVAEFTATSNRLRDQRARLESST